MHFWHWIMCFEYLLKRSWNFEYEKLIVSRSGVKIFVFLQICGETLQICFVI